ncbi:transposon Tf2-11 polyprotein [Trichonephila clavipes]|nr:transposon Tf2-11 polyprotein [Trichonephila clavipes]
MNLKDPSGRLARWALRLQEHDFDVKYKTGKKHSDADALSRNPVEEETETSDKFLAVTTSMNLAMEQKKDQDLAKLKLLSNSSKNEEFRFIDGILCRKNFDPDGKLWLPVIPKHLRADILRHFHDAPTAGHLGFAKTYDRIRKRFYWPGMYRNVVRYVMHCRECQRRKSVPQRPPGRLVPIPPAIAPFHRIGIDLLGRFPKSAHGNKWIIVCTDYSTRYAITKALPTAEVDEIAKFLLEEIVLRHGAPRVIITDRGAVFRSRLVSSLVDLCNIDHRFTTAYHPQTNGLTERFNKTLADMLSMYVDVEQKNWDEILPFVTFAYNTAKQETTGFTPFYLLHGREAETTLDTMLPFCPNDFDDNNITKIAARAEESRQLARVHTLRAQDKDRRRYDGLPRQSIECFFTDPRRPIAVESHSSARMNFWTFSLPPKPSSLAPPTFSFHVHQSGHSVQSRPINVRAQIHQYGTEECFPFQFPNDVQFRDLKLCKLLRERNLILNSTNYDEEFVREMLNARIEERLEGNTSHAPNEFKEHHLDEWSGIISPVDLACKIEEYEDCFECGSYDHFRRKCPKLKKYSSETINRLKSNSENTSLDPYTIRGKVNGFEMPILRDTGASIDIICEKFITPNMFTGENVWVQLILDKHMICLPLSEVEIDCEWGHVITKEAVVRKQLDQGSYIFGNQTIELLESDLEHNSLPRREIVNAIQTRKKRS